MRIYISLLSMGALPSIYLKRNYKITSAAEKKKIATKPHVIDDIHLLVHEHRWKWRNIILSMYLVSLDCSCNRILGWTRPGHKNRKPNAETEITETETENTETDLTKSYFGCHSSETEINFGIRFLFGLNRINRKAQYVTGLQPSGQRRPSPLPTNPIPRLIP
jgi:hypothetical protein